eukprot:15364439-Ditylum_brightwellii.AAC.4
MLQRLLHQLTHLMGVPSVQMFAPPQATPTSYAQFAQVLMAPLALYPTVPHLTITHATVPQFTYLVFPPPNTPHHRMMPPTQALHMKV